ncbi:hyaluronidase A-like isoform X2 [Chelonus insularis]|uniref:hyaluronidase A-like isoform X2 n=1 Tax=Chelonus insularis TaxID=460826 RepID=UPI00158F548F|nr:hyaluronidase A-like isoform X2 [Chelonus insularis]
MNLWENVIVYLLYLFHLRYVQCYQSSTNFTIFWAVPTFLCKNYKIDFDDFLESIPVIRNSENLNKKNKIVTFNNPDLLDDRLPEKMGMISYVSLQKNDIREKIYSTFKGLGVLNYTMWQPIFRQNCGSLEYFYNNSIEMERKLYPLLNEDQTRELAEMRFEFATSIILTNSIKNIQNSWPLATWGLFDYPKCFLTEKKLSHECDREVIEDNDKLSWLWELDIALFPSIFIPVYGTYLKKENFVEARLREARRISQKYNPPLKIYPYLALSYDDYELLIRRTLLLY